MGMFASSKRVSFDFGAHVHPATAELDHQSRLRTIAGSYRRYVKFT